MQRPDTVDGLFQDGNPLTGVKGTPITSEWLNALIAVGAFLSGNTEPPAAELGGPGDYYVCKIAPFNLYGPKDAVTGWPGAATRLQGDTISIGVVTTGEPGSPVTVENVGTARDLVLDISIPRGPIEFTEDDFNLSDVTTADVSTTKHGLTPKLPNIATQFLTGIGTWETPPAAYTLPMAAGVLSAPADATTYYFGGLPALAPQTTVNLLNVYVPKGGTIKIAYFTWYAAGQSGSAESISLYIRVGTTDTLVASVATTGSEKIFVTSSLNIAVAAGEGMQMKLVCPTWASNPSNVFLGGYIYVE
jgi:hypothetical protein